MWLFHNGWSRIVDNLLVIFSPGMLHSSSGCSVLIEACQRLFNASVTTVHRAAAGGARRRVCCWVTLGVKVCFYYSMQPVPPLQNCVPGPFSTKSNPCTKSECDHFLRHPPTSSDAQCHQGSCTKVFVQNDARGRLHEDSAI